MVIQEPDLHCSLLHSDNT